MEEDKSESADNQITSVKEMLNGKFLDEVRASLQPTARTKMAVWVPYTDGTNSNDTPSQPDTAVAEPAQPVADTLSTTDELPSDAKDTRQLVANKDRDADRARLAHSFGAPNKAYTHRLRRDPCRPLTCTTRSAPHDARGAARGAGRADRAGGVRARKLRGDAKDGLGERGDDAEWARDAG